MSTPHRCPVCGGARQVQNPNIFGHTAAPLYVSCPACGGSGVIWEVALPAADPPVDPYADAKKAIGEGLDEYMRGMFRFGPAPAEKTLDVTSSKDFPEKASDVQVFGDPDRWRLVCKASSKSQGWMKSTKAMEIPYVGVLVQVSTQQGEHVAEAVCFVPCTMEALFPVKQYEPPVVCISPAEALKDAEDEHSEVSNDVGVLAGNIFKG